MTVYDHPKGVKSCSVSDKGRSGTRASQESQQAQRWPQLAILGAVALLVAAVVILKNRPTGPAFGAESESAATTAPGARWSAGPDELPKAQLQRLLAAGQPTLAFFHSNNCVECTKMIKIVADVYPEFEDSVALVDVNVYDPQNRTLLQQARVQYIPTLIFYNVSGEESEFIVGAIPRQRFRFLMRETAGDE